jgi:intraflagellar transport protein 140
MALFFDFKTNLQDHIPTVAAWFNSEFQPLLAVGTQGGTVLFFNEEGEPLGSSFSRNSTPLKMAWHPSLPAVYIGWEDGTVSYWHDEERALKEDTSAHSAKVTGLVVSPLGSRMVTGDLNGGVGVWSVSRGMTPVCSYRKEGSVTQLAYCALATQSEGASLDKMNTYFFFGGTSGSVYLADDLKRCTEVCKVGGHIKSILYYREMNSIIIVTSTLLLVQFRISLQEKLVPDRKVKLTVAGNPDDLMSLWAGSGLLATVAKENMLRLWNLKEDKNYYLTLADADLTGRLLRDKVICAAYHEKKRILAGGTQEGRIVMWKSKSLATGEAPGSSDGWEPLLPVTLSNSPITDVRWTSADGLLSAQSTTHVSVLAETLLKKKVKEAIIALQVSNNSVEIRRMSRLDQPMTVATQIRVKGLDVTEKYLAVWNGKSFEVFLINEFNVERLCNFQKNAVLAGVHNESIIIFHEQVLELCNLQGVVKQSISSEVDSEIVSLDIFGQSLVLASESTIKIWELTRREPRMQTLPRSFQDKTGKSLGLIRMALANCNGTKIALLVDQCPSPATIFPDTSIYVYDTEIDNFISYDFGSNQVPVEAAWDTQDPRLLLVESEGMEANSDQEVRHFNEATTLFVTPDYGITKHETKRIEATESAIVGLAIPYMFLMGKDVGSQNLSGVGKFIKKPLRDFTGLESCDEATKKSLLNFAFFLSAGNLDEAYRAVKAIQNVQVWENMCQMCVKTKRLDVAEVCLGNMRFARGMRAVRLSKSEPEIEAQLAMVGLQLGMLNEAKALYEEGGRFDLLNEMLQASGKWEEAVQVAEKHDRLNLKSTYFRLAQNYEAQQDFSSAIEYYELAEVHCEEVPRMLYSNLRLTELETYVNSKQEPRLYSWWGHFLQSQQDYQKAFKCYQQANDQASIVRLLVNQREIQQAAEICNSTGDPLACYSLAKHLEAEGGARQAIQYYAKSGRYYNAVRLARAEKLDGEVMSLSLQSEDRQLLGESARYFEEKHLLDRAVILYHKARQLQKALELCFVSNNFEYLRALADDLGEEEDPETLQRAADYFMENRMYDKAVHLYVSCRQYSKALEICLQHNVKLDENLVDKLIPEQKSNDPRRLELQKSIAKLLKKQGSFQMACKLYTKVGDKLKAFKCLLKLGDLEKIVYYANTAKVPHIYVMAANYLQNAQWHNDAELMKNIINFYSRAKAFDSLANFFDACASVEIDEYRDYEKAMVALQEAIKYAGRSTSPNKASLVDQLTKRVAQMRQFVEARSYFKSDPQQMLRRCQELLETPGIEENIRIGDVYAQLVEFFFQQQQYSQAHNYIEQMRARRILINPYLDPEMIEEIRRRLGLPTQDEEDEVEEDL